MRKKGLFLALLTAGLIIVSLILLLCGLSSHKKARLFEPSASAQMQEPPNDALLSLKKKLESARQLTPEGKISYKKFSLTQEELNAYIKLNYGHKIPAEIKSWQVRLREDEALILIVIDLDEFREALEEQLSPMAKMLLRGEITLRSWGNFYGIEGVGKYDIKALRLGILPIPVSLVKRMIASKSSEEDSAVLDKGFPLPDGFNSAKVSGSRIIINYDVQD